MALARRRGSKRSEEEERIEHAINRACHRLLSDLDFEHFLNWWRATSLQAAMPAGPVDPYRLAMKQGDGERLLMVQKRAAAHARAAANTEKPDDEA